MKLTFLKSDTFLTRFPRVHQCDGNWRKTSTSKNGFEMRLIVLFCVPIRVNVGYLGMNNHIKKSCVPSACVVTQVNMSSSDITGTHHCLCLLQQKTRSYFGLLKLLKLVCLSVVMRCAPALDQSSLITCQEATMTRCCRTEAAQMRGKKVMDKLSGRTGSLNSRIDLSDVTTDVLFVLG